MRNNMFRLAMVLLFICSLSVFGAQAGSQYIEESAEDTWKEAYKSFLKDFQRDSQYDRSDYAWRDLDQNGIPELIVIEADDVDGNLTVYSYDGSVFKIGDYSNPKIGVAGLTFSTNPELSGLFTLWWGGGVEHYGYLTVKDRKLIYEDLWYADHVNETEIEVSGDKELINESKKVESAGNILEMYPLHTVAETKALNEDIYYQYIRNQLIPQYGLDSLDSAYGMLSGSDGPSWFYPGGIVSAYINDLDRDGNEELLLFYFQESESNDPGDDNEPYSAYDLHAAVYRIQNGVPARVDDMKIHAYNGRDVSINSNHWLDTNLFISSVMVENNPYIVFEFTELATVYADLYYQNYWGIELVDDKLQFSFSFSQSINEWDGVISFVEYRFKNGTLISEEPVDIPYDLKERINRFFDSVGIAAVYQNDKLDTEHDKSILENNINKEKMLSYQIEVNYVGKKSESSNYIAILTATDYTDLRSRTK